MATILVVDDVALDRHLAGTLLEEHSGWSAIYAEDGREALSLIKRKVPDLVLTDLQMPELNGLELVEAIRRDYAHVPVILMTAHGSEDIAVAALKRGAASYVPKRDLARDLVPTTEKVLGMARFNWNQQQVLDCLVETELTSPTEVKVVGTFPVPFTEFLGESRSRGRHTECACYFCRTRPNCVLSCPTTRIASSHSSAIFKIT